MLNTLSCVSPIFILSTLAGCTGEVNTTETGTTIAKIIAIAAVAIISRFLFLFAKASAFLPVFLSEAAIPAAPPARAALFLS